MKYDTIIIGAGLSGLAAGIRLAYFEKSVCILERHTTIGGLNSFYRLRKHDHDVGLHAVTNYARPGTRTGPLSKLLRQLRLRWEDFHLSPQLESRILFPGRTLKFTNNFEVFRQQVAEQFPRQMDGFRRLLGLIDEHAVNAMQPSPASARKVVSGCISDPVLADMLFCPTMYYGSATPHDMDITQFSILFRAIFREGLARPWEGIRLILKNLVRKFKSLGGDLKLRSGVRSILSERGRATGVRLDDGCVLEANNVLSSAGSLETMSLCDRKPDDLEQLQPGEISFFESIFTLDRPPADLDFHQAIVFFNDSETFRYGKPDEPVDLHSGIVCSPNNFDYDTPLNVNRIRVTGLANHHYWMNLPEHEYIRQKEAWRERVVESALRFVPDFRGAAADIDTFTPRTIRKFTGHLNGSVYGAPRKFSSGRTHLDNLFLCGTDQGLLGIIGAMLSGILVANTYLLR